MAVSKITEKEIADNIRDSAYVLITQPELTDEGTEVESLRRVPIDMLFADINNEIASLKSFHPIAISNVSNNVGTVEIGVTIDAVTVSWTLNKEPVSQTVDGKAVDAADRTIVVPGPFTTGKTFAITVTDAEGNTASKSTSITFLNGVYYGVLADGARIDSAAILSLSRKLQSGRAITFTANAGAGQKHAYAIPSRYGTPTFKDAETGFQAGFYLATEEPVLFTNASGYTEEYNVWLSTHPALGSMTVAVS